MANKEEKIQIGQIEINFLLESIDTAGQMSMFEFTVPPNAKVPLPHYHLYYDEIIYGLEGTITFTVDGKLHDVGVGETCFIKRGAVHGFVNNKDCNGKVLTVITPALIGSAFFKEQAAIVNAGGPPDIEQMKVVFKKYGLVPVLPDSKPA